MGGGRGAVLKYRRKIIKPPRAPMNLATVLLMPAIVVCKVYVDK